jgi:subtilisin family serine protease
VTTLAVVFGAVGIACVIGCGKKEPASGPGCAAGEHAVQSTCVPDVFATSDLAVTEAALLEVEGGIFYTRETLIVMLKDANTRRSEAEALFAPLGGRVVGAAPFLGFYQVGFSDAATPAALDAKQAVLGAAPAVAFAMRDIGVPGSLDAEPRPQTPLERLTPTSRFQPMWGAQDPEPPKLEIGADGTLAWQQIGFPAAWDSIYQWNPRPSPIVVAVLDGPLVHDPVFDLPFVGGGDHRPSDGKEPSQRDEQHGTAVASIIAAANDDQHLLGGIATGLTCLQAAVSPQIVAFKNGDQDPLDGSTQASAIARGLIVAVNAGARVINGSMGLPAPPANPKAVADLATLAARVVGAAPRVLFVFSGGNDSTPEKTFDAANHFPSNVARTASNAISVGATDRSFIDGAAREVPRVSSNQDPQNNGSITLAAPGTDVLALLPSGGLTKFGGTSAAAPLVSGTAALLFQIDPRLSGSAARKILVDTADAVPGLAAISGRRLNARAAVDKALAGLPPEQRGKGTCRDPDDNRTHCTSGTWGLCTWCVQGTIKVPAGVDGPEAKAYAGGLGELWLFYKESGELEIGLSGSASPKLIMTAPRVGRDMTKDSMIARWFVDTANVVSTPGKTHTSVIVTTGQMAAVIRNGLFDSGNIMGEIISEFATATSGTIGIASDAAVMSGSVTMTMSSGANAEITFTGRPFIPPRATPENLFQQFCPGFNPF